jgi:DnaJ-class molecular chaperone
MNLTPQELAAAKRAAARILEAQREDSACPRCHGQGQIESGTAIDGPESMGDGHACFAPCPECAGTGRGEGV